METALIRNISTAMNATLPSLARYAALGVAVVPGMAIVDVLAFTLHRNEFFRLLIFILSEKNYALPLGLVALQGNLGTGSISVVLAGVILSKIPAVVAAVRHIASASVSSPCRGGQAFSSCDRRRVA